MNESEVASISFAFGSLSLASSCLFFGALIFFFFDWTTHAPWLVLCNLILTDIVSAIYYIIPHPDTDLGCSILASIGIIAPIASGIWNLCILFLLLYFGWLKRQFYSRDDLFVKVLIALLSFVTFAWLIPAILSATTGLLDCFGKNSQTGPTRCWIRSGCPFEEEYYYLLITLTIFDLLAYLLLLWQQHAEEQQWTHEFGLYLPVYIIVCAAIVVVHFVDNPEVQIFGAVAMPIGGFLNACAWVSYPLSSKLRTYFQEDHEDDSGALTFTPENENLSFTNLFGHNLAYVAPINHNKTVSTPLFA